MEGLFQSSLHQGQLETETLAVALCTIVPWQLLHKLYYFLEMPNFFKIFFSKRKKEIVKENDK
jgi:hypothetical protein